MAQTTYTLTEADIGAILPADGYLVSFDPYPSAPPGMAEAPEFTAASKLETRLFRFARLGRASEFDRHRPDRHRADQDLGARRELRL